MKILPILSTALLSLSTLAACQGPMPVTRQLSQASTPRQQAREDALSAYYPTAAGHRWTFALEQTQNGSDNTKFKTMHMSTEALPPEGGAERAIYRRVYPDSTVTPTPSLAKRFPDRIELSRWQPPADARQTASDSFGLQMPVALPAGARPAPLPNRTNGYIVAMQLPFEPGKAWEGRSFTGGSETIAIKGFEDLTVPAGKFRALVVEHHLRYDNGREDYLRYWYAPGVGMVKMYEELTAYFGQWLKFRSTGVLTEYSLPGGRKP